MTKANVIIYRPSQTDCATYLLIAKYNPNPPNRKIARSIHEAARDVTRRIAMTPENLVSRCARKKVKMLFAYLKRVMKLNRLRLRGLTGATDEFTLAATVQNLRRMTKRCLTGRRPGYRYVFGQEHSNSSSDLSKEAR